MSWTGWRKFRPFTDYLEINHFVGHPGKGGNPKWNTTLEGKKGFLSQNEGCRPKDGSEFDYEKLNEQKPIKPAAVGVYFIRINGCTEHESGYFDYIGLSNSQPKKGKNSNDHGIYNRLYDHYRKIVGLPKRGDLGLYVDKNWKNLSETTRKKIRNDFANKEFKDYQHLRSYLEDLSGERYRKGSTERFLELSQLLAPKLNTIMSIKSFFESEVKLSFNTYIPSVKNKSANEAEIAKGEGLALQAYKHRYNAYPFLNRREEGKAVVDFESLFAPD